MKHAIRSNEPNDPQRGRELATRYDPGRGRAASEDPLARRNRLAPCSGDRDPGGGISLLWSFAGDPCWTTDAERFRTGPVFVVCIEDEIYPWPRNTITTEEIAKKGGGRKSHGADSEHASEARPR